MGIIAALAIFSFVIFVHEFGHFIVGLKLGAEPEELSIGFGKPLFKRNIRGVFFKIGSIPLGGYVKFKKDANHPDVHLRVSHWRGILIYLAGPLFNFLLSYSMLFFAVVAIGLSAPDKKFPGKILTEIQIEHKSRSSIVIDSFLISNGMIDKGSRAIVKILKETWKPESLVTETSGPVGITNEINKTYNTGTWMHLYFFTMLLSISVGISNLLPLGILDGGRIFSSILKLTFGERTVTPFISWYDRFSIALLLSLAVIVTIKDIFEVIFKSSGK